MSDETLFAVIDADGGVETVIVADQEFIDGLKDAIADPDHDTGLLSTNHTFIDVTAVDPRPGAGWTYAKKKFIAPVLPPPTQEELDAQAAAAAAAAAAVAAAELRAEDDAFLDTVQTKLRAKKSLTQDERDRMLAIDLSRR